MTIEILIQVVVNLTILAAGILAGFNIRGGEK